MNAARGEAPDAPVAAHAIPERTRWGQVVLLVVAGIVAAMMFSKVAAIFIPVRDHFAADDVVTGLAMSLPALVAVVLGVSAGVLVGELGARRVLLVCLVAGAALSLIQAIPMPIWLFLLLRVVEGAAHLGIVVSAPVIVISLTVPRQRGLAMAIWSTFFGLAFAIAGWLAPGLAEAGGPALVFVVHGVLMLVVAAAIAGFVSRSASTWGTGERLTAARFVREHLDSYRDARSVLPAAAFIWHTFMYTAILTFVPLFGDPADAAFLLVAMPLVSIVGTLGAGAIMRFVTAATVLVAGYLLVAAAIGAVWWAISVDLGIVVVATVLMLFSGLIQGGSFALIPALSGDSVVNARANGTLTQLGNVGSVTGPPVLAAVIAGPSPSFGPFALIVIAACAAGASISVVAWRRIRRTDAASA